MCLLEASPLRAGTSDIRLTSTNVSNEPSTSMTHGGAAGAALGSVDTRALDRIRDKTCSSKSAGSMVSPILSMPMVNMIIVSTG